MGKKHIKPMYVVQNWEQNLTHCFVEPASLYKQSITEHIHDLTVKSSQIMYALCVLQAQV